jgi:AbrB family looped-hinge helix DNA binding protein
VIPKAIREKIGIEPGDEVSFEADGAEVRVRRIGEDPVARAAEIKALRGAWTDTEGGGTAALEEERRRERELEEQRAQRSGVGRPR